MDRGVYQLGLYFNYPPPLPRQNVTRHIAYLLIDHLRFLSCLSSNPWILSDETLLSQPGLETPPQNYYDHDYSRLDAEHRSRQ